MKKQQVDHVLRAAGRLTGYRRFIIIGSQSLHGKYPDLPDEILRSAEVDLIAGKKTARTEWLNVIGYLSPLHETFGYYADPVDAGTATLPKGWKGRLVSLPPGETEGVRGLCLEPHDLAIAKYAAAREKDLIFTRELVRRDIVAEERLLLLLDQTQVDEAVRIRIRDQIAADFRAARDRDSIREREPAIPQQSVTALHGADELEAIKARGREEWLKLRRQANAQSRTRKSTRTLDLESGKGLERDSEKRLNDDDSE
jgi:hypothetical protein